MMAGKFWREAASLMVVGRIANLNSKVASKDFEMLLLQRNKKSSFFPDYYVFPGGVTELSDFSESWLDVFKKCGYSSADLQTQFRKKAPLPEIYKKSYPILPEVGFRIAAIRETFEECGLLLAQHFPYKDLTQDQFSEWQYTVHQDGSQFLRMFQELGGCPAIWHLHEWITWLTPAYKASRRFNTAFFITFMEKLPQIVVDNKELVDVQVATPEEFLKRFESGALLLPPPQIYELGRLLNFDSYDELKKFACERERMGMEQLFPVKVLTSNGVIACLPGDDLYPEQPDYSGEKGPIVVQESIEELRNQGKNLHRMEIRNLNEIDVILNISPNLGHMAPHMKFVKHLKGKM